jgi:preprotein translocase subunit YajC
MITPGMPLALLAQAASGGSSLLPIVVQFGAIIAIFYFLMIRPQQKQRRQHEDALRGLKRGDEVVTSGGIVGEVIHIREMNKEGGNKLDDRVTIKSGESRLVIERGRIAKIIGATATPAQGGSAST